jgi:hypothetical protein
LIAAGAAVALTALVIVVSTIGGGDDAIGGPAPDECVKAWNADNAALAYGRHNFTFHKYEGALVTYLDDAGEVVDADEGRCAVVFPSRALDPEPPAAGQILEGRQWMPISTLDRVELPRVAELQAEAAGEPNTHLDVYGRITAF